MVQLGGAAAVAGGALRVADAYLAVTGTARTQQIAYFITDILLLFGLCGLYLVLRRALGIAGHLGFAAAVGGLFVVRASSLAGFGQNGYVVGAAVTLVGVVAMGAAMMARTSFPRLGPALWIASFAVGLLGLISAKISWAVALAGVIFGAGFVAAGVALLRMDSATPSGQA